jgi:putative RecB family exonuclease
MVYSRKASASQINLYHSCPYRWYLKYKKGIKEPTTVPLIKGSLIHAVIEEFYKLNPKKCGITLKNYEIEFPKYMMQVFDNVLVMERKVFGKDAPTFNDELRNLCSNDIEYVKELSDAKTIIKNYMYLFLMQFEQYAKKADYFNIAWYSIRLKFSELELSTDTFIGYVDALIVKDGSLIITDWKTSHHYRLGYSEEYERQLKLYAGIYYKIYGVIPDYGCINFIRFGIQCLYPINKETIEQEVDDLISEFLDNTQSDDPNDYVKNYDYQFCTCNKSKHKDKNWCWYSTYCDNC